MIKFEHRANTKANNMKSGHMHDSTEVYFLLSGGRRYFIGHYIYDVEPGDVVLIKKNELHHTVARGSKGFDRFLLSYDDCDTDISGLESGCYRFTQQNADRVREAFHNISTEFKLEREYCDLFVRHYLNGILLNLLRYGIKKPHSETDNVLRIQSAARFISENFANDITLEDAAAAACMESTYFSKRFKKLTGFGFCEYLKEVRLREGKRLLANTGMSVSEIAEMCGFSGSNYFGDVFKKTVGISPTEYREKNKTDA